MTKRKSLTLILSESEKTGRYLFFSPSARSYCDRKG